MDKTFIDKLAFIEIKNRKLLVSLSKGKDTWFIPGGKREGSETDLQALTREVKEELSVDIIPESVKLYGVFEAQAHGKPEGTIVRMTCYSAKYIGLLTPNSEIGKIDFFTYSHKIQCSPVDNLIFDDLRLKGLID
jgi:8-oxo-dGTP diphosphatase